MHLCTSSLITDFIGMTSLVSLFQFYTDNWPLQCEVDAYGDFLQALGPSATAKVLYYYKRKYWLDIKHGANIKLHPVVV